MAKLTTQPIQTTGNYGLPTIPNLMPVRGVSGISTTPQPTGQTTGGMYMAPINTYSPRPTTATTSRVSSSTTVAPHAPSINPYSQSANGYAPNNSNYTPQTSTPIQQSSSQQTPSYMGYLGYMDYSTNPQGNYVSGANSGSNGLMIPNSNGSGTVPYTGFSIDTSNPTTDHVSGNATPNSVLTSALNTYQATAPNSNAYAQATMYSPEQLTANQDVLTQQANARQIQQNYLTGVSNTMAKPEAMDFQQGQEAALTRQNALLGGQQALKTEAATANANYLEQIRQNNIAAIQAQQTGAQNLFGNQLAAANYGLQAGQLGVSQAQVAQQRYSYQSIIGPNGTPTIQIMDNQTGQPVGNVDPMSSMGQQISNSGQLVGGTSGNTQGNTQGNAVVNSTMQMMGIQQDMPVSQAIQTYGIGNIVNGLIGQEGGSPQGVMNNPGNIKFAGLPGQINSGVKATDGGTFASYQTPQAGAQAVASLVNNAAQSGKNLSSFIASYKGVALTQPNSVLGQARDNSEILSSVKQQFPIPMQNGIHVTASGIPYINLAEVSGSYQQYAPTVAANISNKIGMNVKVFSDNDVKGLQAMDTINQSLNQMTILAKDVLNPAYGGLGTFANWAKNTYGQITGTNPKISDFNVYKDSAIKAVTALAGGAGSGLRLNTSTIEAAVNNLPTKGDSLETAMEKINKTRDLLNIQLGTAFSNPAIGNGIVHYNGHSYNSGDMVYANGKMGVVNPDGTITTE